MRSFSVPFVVAVVALFGAGRSVAPAADLAATPAPSVASSPSPGDLLPTIGRTRAVTTFCRRIVDDGSALASGQLDDILTTTQALRILALAPFDRNIFIQRRASLALETLSARLMTSRQGAAKTYVADLRRASKDVPADGTPIDAKHLAALPVDPAHADLARFAAALDGAHAESSHVAHQISRAVATLGTIDDTDRTAFASETLHLPDQSVRTDPRLAPALAPAPFPVDVGLDRGLDNRAVENGPLHLFARAMAFEISDSLERMLGSIAEARQLYPTAFVGCTDVDEHPGAAPSVSPTSGSSAIP